MSELQISLIVLGAAAVIGILAYNHWQDRKQRSANPAATVAEAPADPPTQADAALGAERERVEPSLGDADGLRGESGQTVDTGVAAERVDAVAEIPSSLADPRVDCIVRVEAAERVTAHDLWAVQQEIFDKLRERVCLLGWNEGRARWEAVSAHGAAGYRQIATALQLADRRGAATEDDAAGYLDGIQQLADRFLAVADLPRRVSVLAQAAELDRFCAGVDVQIGINIIANDGASFAGAKLSGMAQDANLRLADDGAFHYLDGGGRTQFCLANLEPALFVADEMASLVTHGLTLTLDVPRVSDGAAALDVMIVTAQKLALGLNGSLVDDNRAPLSDTSLQVIRGKVIEFQDVMEEHGISAGGALALRLFA